MSNGKILKILIDEFFFFRRYNSSFENKLSFYYLFTFNLS